MERFRVGVDIGGTFTDVTVVDEESKEHFHLKVLTTNRDPALGVAEALDRADIPLDKVTYLSHGTTIAINAILENKGARTAILTTRGFRDVLEMRRGARTHLLDALMDKPRSFVPRRWRWEVNERILSDGTVLQSLDEGELNRTLAELTEQGIESVAVCFLHSYVNPVHEARVGEIIEARYPWLAYTLSADLVPEIKEYERTSTAALNAFVQPVARSYLSALDAEMRNRGLKSSFRVMQSNGGLMSVEEASRRPIHILESGPAAGSIAAAALGRLMGIEDLITFDMGGTTMKASVIERGQPLTTTEFELFETFNKPGSGWPLRVPMIDILEAGAGGGSVAWLDHGGALQVGPRSAGAEPGPVCYGRGGEEPTITDANAILGRLVALLAGALPLDVDVARRALQEKVAGPLGMSVEDAAAGILEIADAKTADIIREVTIARGRDPRNFALVVFGGAGPLQAAHVLRELGTSQAIIPPAPGNFSALGLLSTDIIHDLVRPYRKPLASADLATVNDLYEEMESVLTGLLLAEDIPDDRVVIHRTVDMRYKGQFHHITVNMPPGRVASGALTHVAEAFHGAHQNLYTYHSPGEALELVNLRVRGVGVVPRAGLKLLEPGLAKEACTGHRLVYFREAGETRKTKVYARDSLGAGATMVGPAIIEEHTSTTLVPPGAAASVDQYANIVIRSA